MSRAPGSPAKRRRAWHLALPLGALCGGADAQLLQDPQTVVVPPPPPITTAHSIFARDSTIPVADRMLPAFSAQGLSVGNFDLYPGLTIGGLYTSNLYADNDRKRSDAALVIRPQATLRTSGGPYVFSVYGQGDIRRYATHGSENSQEGLGGAEGSVAIGPLSSITAGVNYGTLIDPRYASDSPKDAAHPLQFDQLNGYLGTTIEGASTRVILRADVTRLRFSDTPAYDGSTLFTRDRDRTRYGGLVRVERALSPAISFYAAGTLNKIDYRYLATGNLQRDSWGYGAYLGSSFDVTRLARGDIRLGYIHQTFQLPGVDAIAGLGALGTLQFFPNQLWTFTAQGERSVQDSGVPGTAGYVHAGASLRADHELRRYIIASVAGGYFEDSYRGIDRRDRLPFAEVSGTYLSRDHWNARLGYRFLSRHCGCNSGIASFDDHRITAALTFQY
ncbi:outer membrane beta-barrel protein [Sphingomonas sp. CROZ-RG-20F-R02-07]|uniref:outer membrane beta-barrel protein n=1 Tax=Sphingomonas sp. CROZ-RG-20F-R02-07 TaxID=2914832 RepID=UPI001F5726A0|nr:outer membrane beta-barrel protein [Sphingomonas sp. CROZ-RG-20F-R02-07]